jgi:hypothetical protein
MPCRPSETATTQRSEVDGVQSHAYDWLACPLEDSSAVQHTEFSSWDAFLRSTIFLGQPTFSSLCLSRGSKSCFQFNSFKDHGIYLDAWTTTDDVRHRKLVIAQLMTVKLGKALLSYEGCRQHLTMSTRVGKPAWSEVKLTDPQFRDQFMGVLIHALAYCSANWIGISFGGGRM